MLLEKFDTVLGLKISEETEKKQEEIPADVLELVEERKIARNSKNWSKSDELRNKIEEKGYEVKDLPQGKTEVKKKN